MCTTAYAQATAQNSLWFHGNNNVGQVCPFVILPCNDSESSYYFLPKSLLRHYDRRLGSASICTSPPLSLVLLGRILHYGRSSRLRALRTAFGPASDDIDADLTLRSFRSSQLSGLRSRIQFSEASPVFKITSPHRIG